MNAILDNPLSLFFVVMFVTTINIIVTITFSIIRKMRPVTDRDVSEAIRVLSRWMSQHNVKHPDKKVTSMTIGIEPLSPEQPCT